MSGSPSPAVEPDPNAANSVTNLPTTPAVRPDPPPLRLVHLLLYVTICGCFLSFVSLPRAAETMRSTLPAPGYYVRVQIDAAFRGLFQSALVTITVLLAIWRLRGMRAGNLPGHWIAICYAWGLVSTFCIVKLIDIAEWLVRVHHPDDYIRMWPWAKSFYLLQDAPFALLFILFALNLRSVANTWPWKMYFGWVGLRLAYYAIRHLPFDWSVHVYSVLPTWTSSLLPSWVSQVFLLVALLTDLLPRRPKRHWSHWIAAVQPVLMAGLDFATWGTRALV